jgi:hypothetical protein
LGGGRGHHRALRGGANREVGGAGGRERVVSYRRRILRGTIDLVRGELVRRGVTTRSAEELVRALIGDRRQ